VSDTDTLRYVRLDDTGYTLETWDTGRTISGGKSRLGYRLTAPDGTMLFEGEDFGCSPLHAIDSDNALRAILGFLTLKYGDTDRDYFDSYTGRQLEFSSSSDCERLAFLFSDDPSIVNSESSGRFIDVDAQANAKGTP